MRIIINIKTKLQQVGHITPVKFCYHVMIIIILISIIMNINIINKIKINNIIHIFNIIIIINIVKYF